MPIGNTSNNSVFMQAWDYFFGDTVYGRCSLNGIIALTGHMTHTHYSQCGQRRRPIFLVMCFMSLCVRTLLDESLQSLVLHLWTDGGKRVKVQQSSWRSNQTVSSKEVGGGVRWWDFIIVWLLFRIPAGWAVCCFKLYSGPQCAERGLLIWDWGAGDVKCRCFTG